MSPGGLAPGRPTALVVGFLDRDTSSAALLAAAQLAHRLQARLHVVQVWDDVVPEGAAAGSFVAVPGVAPDQEQVRAAGEAGRLRAAEVLVGSPVSWHWTTAVGKPAQVLQQHADEVDAYLIVIGLRERSFGSFVEHVLVGSTVSQLRQQTIRPLLLVPAAPTTPPDSAPDADNAGGTAPDTATPQARDCSDVRSAQRMSGRWL